MPINEIYTVDHDKPVVPLFPLLGPERLVIVPDLLGKQLNVYIVTRKLPVSEVIFLKPIKQLKVGMTFDYNSMQIFTFIRFCKIQKGRSMPKKNYAFEIELLT